MTPQKKAEEIVNQFYHNNTDYIDSNKDARESAVTCAMIMCDEILKTGLVNSLNLNPRINNQEYWIQVRKELDNF